jgi:hypothetical protein
MQILYHMLQAYLEHYTTQKTKTVVRLATPNGDVQTVVGLCPHENTGTELTLTMTPANRASRAGCSRSTDAGRTPSEISLQQQQQQRQPLHVHSQANGCMVVVCRSRMHSRSRPAQDTLLHEQQLLLAMFGQTLFKCWSNSGQSSRGQLPLTELDPVAAARHPPSASW